MPASLDGPLYAVIRRDPDLLAPLTARAGDVRSLLAFRAAEAAEAHLRALPADVVGAYRVAGVEADDWRGKEELFRAAAAAGATRLELDPDLELHARHVLPLARAVAYAASYKRASACL